MKKLVKLAALSMAAVMLLSSTAYAADEKEVSEKTTVTTEAEEVEETAEEETEKTETEEETEEAAENAEETSPFVDVDVTTKSGKAILKMYNAGVIAGYEDGTFKPDGNITRAELVRVFNQVFKYNPSEDVMANVKDFADNEDPAAWYYNDVRIAQVAGYINGFEDNTFRGKENFTRQQACVVIDLITGVNTYDPALVITDEVSEWANSYVNWAVTAGLFQLEEGNTFRATQNITRSEVCNLLEIFVSEKTEESDDTEETTVEGETQEVTVKTSNGTVVKVSTGGGGGSSSSSSKKTTTTTTTEATTETTTKEETTTESTTETTTKKETTTETTTKEETTTESTTIEIVTNNSPSPEILNSLNNVYTSMVKYVVPNCSTSAQKSVANQISDAIFKYLSNYNYDIASASDKAIEDYRSLPSDEKKELKNLILQYVSIGDLLVLQETYFPGLI